MEKVNNISILGCGWLGLPLAKFLIKKGYQVKGSTSDSARVGELTAKGIDAYQIFFNPEINENFNDIFFNSELLIVNFPPKRRADIEDFHPLQFQSLIQEIKKSKIKHVIFISSTSVYKNTNGVVDEKNNETPEKSSGKALRKVEQMLLNENSFTCSIIRFGGLIGYDRKPGRFFSKVSKAKNGNAPVNLIHRDDCIDIIHHLIKNEIWDTIINACCPEHPTRNEFYKIAAEKGGFPTPTFEEENSEFKVISSDYLIHNLSYKFKYNNPIDAL